MSTATKKRTKHVFRDATEVAHIWAQQVQSDGRTPTKNCYFEGDTIYSYGTHFPIARFTGKTLDGKSVVLLTNRSYSVTTSGHQYAVANALRGLDDVLQIRVENVRYREKATAQSNLESLWQDLRAMAGNHVKARTNDFTGSMRSALENIAHYAEFVKLGRTKQLAELLNAARENTAGWWGPLADIGAADAIAKDAKRLMAIATGDERKRKQREAEEKRLARRGQFSDEMKPIALAAWRSGESTIDIPAELVAKYSDLDLSKRECNCAAVLGYSAAFLRIVGDEIETSRGARVPVRHAKIAWQALKRREIPADRIGHYQPTEFDGDNLVIGCHRIAFSELQYIANELGLSA